MKASLLRAPGRELELVEVELDDLAPDQVRVRMVASGVCHSDLSVITGTLPHPTPCVLGHEGAGVVEEVGPAVTRVRPGDHVILSWNPACRECVWCRADQPFLCEQGLMDAFAAPYGTVDGEPVFRGMTTGTFGEMTQILEKAVVPIPDDVPFEIAALIGCAVTTGVGAVINTAGVTPGAGVAVVGCGGVGLSVIMGAVVAGASTVVAVDLSPERLELAADLGATDTVRAGDGDPVEAVRALTGGVGVDHAFEVVGRSRTIRHAYDMARRGGTCTLVGAGSADDEIGFDAMELFFTGKRILGCVYGSSDPPRDFPRLIELHRSGRLPLDRLITERIGLDGIGDAFAAMEAGRGARSVVVLE